MEFHVRGYDVLDQVHIVCRVWQTGEWDDVPADWETLSLFTFQGTGETDRRTWVSDALIALLERL